MRVVRGRPVADPVRVEQHEVGVGAGANDATVAQPDVLCRQSSHLVDRFLEAQHFELSTDPPVSLRSSSAAAISSM